MISSIKLFLFVVWRRDKHTYTDINFHSINCVLLTIYNFVEVTSKHRTALLHAIVYVQSNLQVVPLLYFAFHSSNQVILCNSHVKITLLWLMLPSVDQGAIVYFMVISEHLGHQNLSSLTSLSVEAVLYILMSIYIYLYSGNAKRVCQSGRGKSSLQESESCYPFSESWKERPMEVQSYHHISLQHLLFPMCVWFRP